MRDTEMRAQPSTYNTSDIALAAALLCAGCCLAGVDKVDRGRAVFEFEDTHEISEHTLRFINGQTQVEPARFLNNIKSLKAMTRQ